MQIVQIIDIQFLLMSAYMLSCCHGYLCTEFREFMPSLTRGHPPGSTSLFFCPTSFQVAFQTFQVVFQKFMSPFSCSRMISKIFLVVSVDVVAQQSRLEKQKHLDCDEKIQCKRSGHHGQRANFASELV